MWSPFPGLTRSDTPHPAPGMRPRARHEGSIPLTATLSTEPAPHASAKSVPRFTEKTMKQALWRHFTEAGYAVLTEFSTSDKDTRRFRRIDVLAMRPARKQGIGSNELLAVEVKVSRSDFLSDVRRPEKQAPWRTVAHRHAYAVPEGLVTLEEVPAESGLIVVSESGKPRFVRNAPFATHTPNLAGRFVMRMAYRAAHAEAVMAGWVGAHGTESEADLRAELDRLRTERETLIGRVLRAESDRDGWRHFVAHVEGVPCKTCRCPIRPRSLSRFDSYRWKHTDPAHEESCKQARIAAAGDNAYVLPVMPDPDETPNWKETSHA